MIVMIKKKTMYCFMLVLDINNEDRSDRIIQC